MAGHDLARTRSLGPLSRVTYYGRLRSYFRFATEAAILPADPMAGMRWPRPGKSIPRPLTPA